MSPALLPPDIFSNEVPSITSSTSVGGVLGTDEGEDPLDGGMTVGQQVLVANEQVPVAQLGAQPSSMPVATAFHDSARTRR